MVGERRYLRDPAPDTVIRHLVEKCRQRDSPMTPFVDRHKTFGAFLSWARHKARPLIVETGCIRSVEDWSAGYATYLLGFFVFHHGGELHSIDLDPTNVAFARSWTGGYGQSVHVHLAHSHDWLQGYTGPPIDLLYLDSADVGTPGYRECSLREVELAVPHLAPDAVILLDDTCWKGGSFQGKGHFSVPWLLRQGWKVITGGYQVLLGRH
jgi:predicted O-methyltransferase YrrM